MNTEEARNFNPKTSHAPAARHLQSWDSWAFALSIQRMISALTAYLSLSVVLVWSQTS